MVILELSILMETLWSGYLSHFKLYFQRDKDGKKNWVIKSTVWVKTFIACDMFQNPVSESEREREREREVAKERNFSPKFEI